MKIYILKLKRLLKNPLIILNRFTIKNFAWSDSNDRGKFKNKIYKNYNEYIKHQQSKLDTVKNTFLPVYDMTYRKELYQRLSNQGVVKRGMTALCLAARIGTEVKSFLDLGCFAVGVDLNPGKNNPLVLYGDFHNLSFPDSSVDVIFCNSLDHAFDLEKLIVEIRRVLKPEGYLILEIVKGEGEGGGVGYYESIQWATIDNVLHFFTDKGFIIKKRDNFTYPWGGQHVSLTKDAG